MVAYRRGSTADALMVEITLGYESVLKTPEMEKYDKIINTARAD